MTVHLSNSDPDNPRGTGGTSGGFPPLPEDDGGHLPIFQVVDSVAPGGPEYVRTLDSFREEPAYYDPPPDPPNEPYSAVNITPGYCIGYRDYTPGGPHIETEGTT